MADRATLERLHEEVDKRLAAQDAADARLETRATFVVGLAVAIAQLVLGQGGVDTGWLIAALACFCAAAGLAVAALLGPRFGYAPDPTPFLDGYRTADLPVVLRALATTKAAVHDDNVRVHRRRTALVHAAFAPMLAGVILAVIGKAVT